MIRTSSLSIEGNANVKKLLSRGTLTFNPTTNSSVIFDLSLGNVFYLDLSGYTLGTINIAFDNEVANSEYMVVVKQHATNRIVSNITGITFAENSNIKVYDIQLNDVVIFSCYFDGSVMSVDSSIEGRLVESEFIVNDITDDGTNPTLRDFYVTTANKIYIFLDILEVNVPNPAPSNVNIYLPILSNYNFGDEIFIYYNTLFTGYTTTLTVHCNAANYFFGLGASTKTFIMNVGDYIKLTANTETNTWI